MNSLLLGLSLLAASSRPAPAPAVSMFGISVAGPGDVDGDGVPDLFVAAPAARHCYLISCKNGNVLRTFPGAWKVAAPGDVDGDGVSDLMTGSWPWDTNSGPTASVFSGKDGSEIRRFAASHVAEAGDLNRDGRPDLVVGKEVRSGRDGSLLLTVDCKDLRGSGDTNGDGTTDFVGIVGLGARVYSGRDGTTLQIFEQWKTRPASVIIGAGDLDGDGGGDVVVGYPDQECSFGTGYVRAFSGKTGGLIHDFQSDCALFGASLLAPGDLDGDGYGDLVIGAYDTMGPNPGWGDVHVYSGSTWKQIDVFWNEVAEMGFGTALAALGDVDKDGVTDLAVGACKWSGSGLPGYTFVYSGKTRKVLRTLSAPTHQSGGK